MISQREAKRLRRRVTELETVLREQRNRWNDNYPGGVNLMSFTVTPDLLQTIKTARALGHACVVVNGGLDGNSIRLYGLPHPKDV